MLKRAEGQDLILSLPTSKQKWGRGKVQNQEQDPQNRRRAAAGANEHIWGKGNNFRGTGEQVKDQVKPVRIIKHKGRE